MKKILLGLGGLATIASPVVLAVSCGSNGNDQGTQLKSVSNEHGIKINYDDNNIVASIEVSGTYYRDINEVMTDVNTLINKNGLQTSSEDVNLIELVTVIDDEQLRTSFAEEIAELNIIEISISQQQLNDVVTIDPLTGRVDLHEIPGSGFMVYLTDSLNSVINDGEILTKKDIVTATVVANEGYRLSHGSAHSASDSFIPHDENISSDTQVSITQNQLDNALTINQNTHVVTITDPNIEGISIEYKDSNSQIVTNGQVLTETSTITSTATALDGYVLTGGSAHSSIDTITIRQEYTLDASQQITEADVQEALDRIHSSTTSPFSLNVHGRHSRGIGQVMAGMDGPGQDNNSTINIAAGDRANITKDSLKTKILNSTGLDYVSKKEIEFAFGRTNGLTNDEIGKIYDWFCNDTWGWPKENFGIQNRAGGKPISLPTESDLLTEFMNKTGGGIVSVNDDSKARLYFSFPKSFGTLTEAQILQISNAISTNTTVAAQPLKGISRGNTGYGENGGFIFTIKNVPMGWYDGQPEGNSEHILITLETNKTGDFVDGWWAHDVMQDAGPQSSHHVLPLGAIISGAH